MAIASTGLRRTLARSAALAASGTMGSVLPTCTSSIAPTVEPVAGAAMPFDHRAPASRSNQPASPAPRPGVGKRTLTEQLPAAVQARATQPPAGSGGDDAAIHAAADRGTATPSSALPHGDRIQRLFGRHDVSAIQAHTGPDAERSARDMGAQAYATGNHVVLGGDASLFTAAHEAAHVVQQRGGVQLRGGVGATGDAYEQHADAVAHSVVAGRSAEGLLDQMAPSGSAGGGHGVQQLPLAASWHRPAADAEMLDSIRGFLAGPLTHEMGEVTADDRGGPEDQYDPGWKSDAVRTFERLKRTVNAGGGAAPNPALAAQLTEHLVELLRTPIPHAPAGPPAAPAPAGPPGRTVTPQHGPVVKDPAKMREESHRNDVKTTEKIVDSAPKLLDATPGKPGVDRRTGGVKQVRGNDEDYSPGQGAILRQFIPEYRAAIGALIHQAGSADAVFSIERGGSLIADMMERMGGITAAQNKKVAKPRRADVEAHYAEGPPPENMPAMLGNPAGQKQVHMALFKQRIHEFVAGRPPGTITIAVTETVVGGGSATLVLKALNELCAELRASADKPVRFKLLMARETIKNTNSVGRGTLKVQDPVHVEDNHGGKGVQFPRGVETDNLAQVEAFISQTRFLIGEDVDYQVQYDGPMSKMPVVVFQGSGADLRAIKVTPAAGADTARQVLLDLVAGALDETMTELMGPG
jgi:hypothetical protein